MSAPEGARTSAEERRSRDLLDRIAAILGCPVEAFDGTAQAGHLGQTADLLRLWLAIDEPDDRRKLLDLTRALAAS